MPRSLLPGKCFKALALELGRGTWDGEPKSNGHDHRSGYGDDKGQPKESNDIPTSSQQPVSGAVQFDVGFRA